MVLTTVLAVLALVGLQSVVSVAGSSHQSATRSFSATVESEGTVTVTIAISGVDSGYIQETLHDDFTFVSSANTHNLSEDGRTLTISFQNRASVSYVVRAPERADTYTFPGGRLRDIAGTVDVPVTGADEVTVTGTGATTAEAERSFSATVESEGTVTVTIAISGVDSGYIQETLHDDFTFVSSANTHNLSEDGRTLTISFQNRASVSYVVRAPERADTYTFPGGRLRDIAGTVDVPVTGADEVTVTGTGATTAEAERSFSATVESEGTVTVTIAISGVDSGYIQETLHDDFTFVSSANTHNLSEDGRTLTISFQNRASVSYVVRAPERADTYTFPGGRLRDIAGTVDVPVTGADEVTVTGTGATTAEAERSFSATVESEGTVTVTIAISGVDSGYIQETLHDDFTFVSSANTHNLSEDGRTLTISFQNRASVSYVVRAPERADTYTFPGGRLRDIAGTVDVPVTGVSDIQVGRTSGEGDSGGGGGFGGGGVSNSAPVFREGAAAARTVAENAGPGTLVGDRVTAFDNDANTITYSFGRSPDADSFSLDAKTGQIAVATGAMLDFEAKNSYAVTVRASDRQGGTDAIAVTIAVTNVDEAGVVTLSPAAPVVGVMLTASLYEPDGNVTSVVWQWDRSLDLATWLPVPGDGWTYTPTEPDAGYHLRATVSYGDVHGATKRAHAVTTETVPLPPAPAATATVVSPAPTATASAVPPAPTATATAVPPAPTATATAVPPAPSATATAVPPAPTATARAVPPAPTATATAVPPPTVAPIIVTPTPEPPTPTATVAVEAEEGGFPVWTGVLVILVGLVLLGVVVFYFLSRR